MALHIVHQGANGNQGDHESHQAAHNQDCGFLAGHTHALLDEFQNFQEAGAKLNRGVTPVIPQKGSLGASGDLAPLSHMVLPMLTPM